MNLIKIYLGFPLENKSVNVPYKKVTNIEEGHS